MSNPIVVAAGVGLLAPLGAGPALQRALDRVPEAWRRRAQWAVFLGAAALAIVADLLSHGRGPEGAFVIVVAALPGTIAYLAWGSLLASAVVSLFPMYFVIGALVAGRPMHVPALALDRAIPLAPSWMSVYGSMYVFVLLTVLIVRDARLFRRALQSYVMVLVVAYAGFLLYPTVTPRPATVAGTGFAVWALRLNYALDSRYNCFPCLHVAHSFVSALACHRVNRALGVAALGWAILISVSTLFVKQHYVVDVIAGTLIGLGAYALFLRRYPRELVPERDRRRAPRRALAFVAIYAVFVAAFWIAYKSGM